VVEQKKVDETAGKSNRGPIAWMTINHVPANFLMALFIIGGLLSAMQITQEVFPEFTFDAVNITVAYPGASPEEVEQGIVLAIEEAVQGVENVVEVVSTAREGSARVTVEYEAGTNPQKIYQDIQQEIDRITTFPDDAEEPQIALASRRRDVMEVQIYGNVSEWSLRNLAEEVRERLLQAEGVTQVDLDRVRDFEIHITPSREMLRAYNLTLQDIASKIARTSIEVPAGGIDTAGGEVLVRFSERVDYAREFAEIPIITTAQGALVRLGDIATVTEAFEDTDRRVTYNGMPAIGIEIYRIGEQTPTGVSKAARAALEQISPSLPEGVSIAINQDRSEVYEQRLHLLLKNMGLGLVLVLALLGLFLEPRLAFWVMLGIPTSFFGAFLFMPLLGVSLNMMSMFAFIIALGIVVDDAIVVGENVHNYRSEGMGKIEAAIKGAREVAMPVTFSILTNCIAFIPLALIPGTMGKIWAVIPIVVISVFLISLVESLFVLPSHLSQLSSEPKNPVFKTLRFVQQHFNALFEWALHRLFSPFLYMCIRHRYLVVSFSLALLVSTLAYAFSGRMGMTLMPKVESDIAVVTATLPVGSPIETAEQIRQGLENSAWLVADENGGDQLVAGIFTVVDTSSVETRVYLTPPGVRPIGTTAFTRLWREKAGEFSQVESLRFESDRGGPGRGPSLNVELSHADVGILEQAAEHLGLLLEDFPSVDDIDDGYQAGKPQLDFTLKPEGRSLGLTSDIVARQIRNAFEGARAIRQQRGRNEVTVRVMLPDKQRRSEYDIEQLMIQTSTGAQVPLRQVAEVSRDRAYTSIQHKDGRRTLEVTANVTPDEVTTQVMATLSSEILPQLVRDYPGLSWTFGGRQSDIRDSLSNLRTGFLFAMLIVYAMLAIPFRSYVQPLTVMVAIPFGTVGAIFGHLVMGYSLSVISMMGIIALSGVVINDALVMIVFANDRRRRGDSALEAIHYAGVRRFRPILLTTLTTFGGLAPMIFETSRQARFMIPMAISLGYGLLFATSIILILVPSLYIIQEDIVWFFKKIFAVIREDEKQSSQSPETVPEG
jgi:multidrug efflux pump subunit AcrB